MKSCATSVFEQSEITKKQHDFEPKNIYVVLYFQTDSEEEMKNFEKQRQEHKLGILLVSISVLFICCQSFKIIPDIYEIMFCYDKTQPWNGLSLRQKNVKEKFQNNKIWSKSNKGQCQETFYIFR